MKVRLSFAALAISAFAGCVTADPAMDSGGDEPSVAGKADGPGDAVPDHVGDALFDQLQVYGSACMVTDSTGDHLVSLSVSVTLRAAKFGGALVATVTSADDPSLVVRATFDGVWNTFEGSAKSAAGTWLDVRGRMTGTALTVSYSTRVTGRSVKCAALTGTATFALPTPVKAPPPPAKREQPDATTTGIHATLRIDTYEGIEHGISDHEHARATIVTLPWVYDGSLLTTMHVELAMREGDPPGSGGLPTEVPLAVGQLIQVEGEYISASVANAPNANGQLDAVIHFTHADCGYVVIAGTRYN